MIDEVLNAVLVALIGVEELALTLTGTYLLTGVLAVPVVLLARLTSVAGPVVVLSQRGRFPRATINAFPYQTHFATVTGNDSTPRSTSPRRQRIALGGSAARSPSARRSRELIAT